MSWEYQDENWLSVTFVINSVFCKFQNNDGFHVKFNYVQCEEVLTYLPTEFSSSHVNPWCLCRVLFDFSIFGNSGNVFCHDVNSTIRDCWQSINVVL